MNPMNTQNNKPKRIPHVRVLSALAVPCLIQFLLASVAFALPNYAPFTYPQAMGGPNGPTGVRGAGGQDVWVTGIFQNPTPTGTPTPTPTCPPGPSPTSHGLLYRGPLNGTGTWRELNFPNFPGITVTGTALYGPDNLPQGWVRLVGSYTKCEDVQNMTGVLNHGLLYDGPPEGTGIWQTIDFPIAQVTPSPFPGEIVHNTIAHSNMGGLVVGNFDTDRVTGKAFVYDVRTHQWTQLINGNAMPRWRSITAYGIWYNGGTSYTITGGYSEKNSDGIDHGYLVNWDSATQTASNWTYPCDFNKGHTHVEISHFDGITTDNHGGFYLTGTWREVGFGLNLGAFFAHVRRDPHCPFRSPQWTDIEYPSSQGHHVDFTTGNTVFDRTVFGIYTENGHIEELHGYTATLQGP